MVISEKNKQILEPVLGWGPKLILSDWLWASPQDVWGIDYYQDSFYCIGAIQQLVQSQIYGEPLNHNKHLSMQYCHLISKESQLGYDEICILSGLPAGGVA